MAQQLHEGREIVLPFFDNHRFICGKSRQGGMGVVHQLIPLDKNIQIMALKTCLRDSSNDQFEHEARAWISLEAHPNIARAHSFGYFQGIPCVVSDWIDSDLSSIRAETASPSAVLSIASGVIRGLLHAYRTRGLLHRDIKPGNIMIDSIGSPRLTDFGLSDYQIAPSLGRPASSPARDDLMSYGPEGGTTFFMAPELFRGAPPSERTEIYAFGVTFYYWIMGAHPHAAGFDSPTRSYQSLLGRTCQKRYGAGIDSLVRLIISAVDIDPDARPSTFEALVSQFDIAETMGSAVAAEAPSKLAWAASITDRALTLKRQLRFQQARSLIESSLQIEPRNTILLNTLANILRSIGDRAAAISVLNSTIQIQRASDFREHGIAPYPDPALNLSLLLLQERRYTECFDLLADLLQVIESDAPSMKSIAWQFGWAKLYSGSFSEAAHLLLDHFSKQAFNTYGLGCFCLAASLSPNRSEHAHSFRRRFPSISRGEGDFSPLIEIISSISESATLSRLGHAAGRGRSGEGVLPSLRDRQRGSEGTASSILSRSELRERLELIDEQLMGGKFNALVVAACREIAV